MYKMFGDFYFLVLETLESPLMIINKDCCKITNQSMFSLTFESKMYFFFL